MHALLACCILCFVAQVCMAGVQVCDGGPMIAQVMITAFVLARMHPSVTDRACVATVCIIAAARLVSRGCSHDENECKAVRADEVCQAHARAIKQSRKCGP